MKKIRLLIPLVIFMMMIALFMTSQASASEPIVIVEDHPSAGLAKMHGQITTIFYGAGTCADKCRFSQTITQGAYKELSQVPKPYYTGVYTRIKNNPAGSYSVCFDTSLLNNPAVYRFVDGFWIYVTGAQQADELCANGSGDGVIGVFGVLHERKSPPTPTPTAVPAQCETA